MIITFTKTAYFLVRKSFTKILKWPSEQCDYFTYSNIRVSVMQAIFIRYLAGHAYGYRQIIRSIYML